MPTIHNELLLAAKPATLYTALTDSQAFSKLNGAPAEGSAADGAAFSAFGGHITGRYVELIPDHRIVQAWRAKTWPEGLYSIACFTLEAAPKGTKLVFDHTGFPADMQAHLSEGWQRNYWDKLQTLG